MRHLPWMFVFCALAAWGQAPQIVDRHTPRSLHDADAARQLKECDRGLTDATIERLLQAHRDPKVEAEGTLAEVASRDSRFHVLVSGSSWICLPFSANGYPIWPIDSLRHTVIPISRASTGSSTEAPVEQAMPGLREAVNAWRRELIVQLANSGSARGLILYASGAGYEVSYTATKGQGMPVRYEGRHLKAGDFSINDFPAVLNTPGVTEVTKVSHGSNRAHLRPAFSMRLSNVPRTLVDGNYLLVKGNPETAAAQFGGSVWKSEAVVGTTELRFEEGGVAISKSASTTTRGRWRLAGDVLRVEFSSRSYMSLVLQDDRFLVGQARLKPVSPNPHIAKWTTIDDPPQQDTYLPLRYHRSTDLAHEDRLRNNKAARLDALIARIELQRRAILAESAEEEDRLQREAAARAGKPEFNWRSCGTAEQNDLIVELMQDGSTAHLGEICHSWVGTRKEWKATILTEGCKGRCRPL